MWARKQAIEGYFKKRYISNKLGNREYIEKLCLNYGFSKEIAKAIAIGGRLLDEKMRERGIFKCV